MRHILAILPLLAALTACVDIPQSSRQQGVRTSSSASYSSPSPSSRQCLAQLGSTNANFSPLPDQYFGSGCSTLNSVKLASLRSDTSVLSLGNLGPVTCPMANSFAGWARFGVDRAARQILGSRLIKIETMGSYACRNVAGTSRRSGHATANAIDVSAFVLADGRRISVLQGWNTFSDEERRFLRIVHQSACKRFGTVLGPEYNAAHKDHFHLEANGKSFCR
ncbi:MAG: extensin family protein [Novosphingobium sp.]|nr:extensin family protein [Novosphingobium sp.]